MSKYRFRDSDIYLPGSDIPANRLGIADADLLHEIEQELLEQAYRTFIEELKPVPVSTSPSSDPSTAAYSPTSTIGLASTGRGT